MILISSLGHQIAIRNTQATQNAVTFIPIPDYVNQVTHIAVSQNKRYLFVAESHKSLQDKNLINNDVFLTVYDIRTTTSPKIIKAHINVTELITPIFNTTC